MIIHLVNQFTAQFVRATKELAHWQVVAARQEFVLHHVASSARKIYREEYSKAIDAKTSVIAEQMGEGNFLPFWELVRALKRSRKRPKLASAPVIDKGGNVVTSNEQLLAMWVQQFSLAFASNAVGLSDQKLVKLLAERRSIGGQLCVTDVDLATIFPPIPDFPNSEEEWLFFCPKEA